MPDPVLIVTAMGVAARGCGRVLLICGWPWRAARPSWVDAGWVLGVGAGFFVGCWVLGIRPHWPPREDLDRLLALVLPAVVVVELLAACPQGTALARSGRCGWPSWRAAPGSCCTGPATSPTSPGQGRANGRQSLAWLILGGLAVARAAVWALLAHPGSPGTGAVAAGVPGGHKRRGGGHGHALRLCDGRAGRAAAGGCSSGGRGRRAGAAAIIAGDRSARGGDRRALQPARDRPLLRRAHLGSRRPVCSAPRCWAGSPSSLTCAGCRHGPAASPA